MPSLRVRVVFSAVAAVVLSAFLTPPSARATDGIPRSSEGVECPSSVGAFTLAPELSHSADDPVNRSLECWYRDSAGTEIALDAYWTLYRDPDAYTLWWCNDPEPGKHVQSKTRSAVVTYDNGGREPAAIVQVARDFLAVVEPHAVTCDPNAYTPTSPPPTTTTTRPEGDKELCAEARVLIEAFDREQLAAAGFEDSGTTGIRVDGADLADDIGAAVDRYNAAHPDDTAYVSDGTPFAGEVGALNWLFANGGGLKGPQADAYVTGTERGLQRRLIDRANELGTATQPAKLTPGEVLEIALELNGGHLNQALLASHNLLRAVSRGDTAAADLPLYDNGFVDRYLVPLRDGENGGPWYHVFGTAYYEVVSQGDWGPWIATGGAVAAWGSGMLSGGATLVLGGIALAWQNTSDASGTTGASRVANGLEQYVRENWTGQRPDPEKYCFNVWGAQVGKRLYERLPYRSTRKFRALLSNLPTPDVAPELDPMERIGEPRYVNAMGSPFSVWWSDGTMQMLLDQGEGLDARLVGGVPGLMLPVAEDDSWGLIWIDPANSAQTVAFEAATDGAVLHFTRTDTRTGQTAFYTATATRAGEQFSMQLDPATAVPILTREDGEVVEPEIVTLDIPEPQAEGEPATETTTAVTTSNTTSNPDSDGDRSATPNAENSDRGSQSGFAIAGLAAVGAIASTIVIARRRRRRSAANAAA